MSATFTFATVGLVSDVVRVAALASSGQPSFDVVGLADPATREARVRVRAAVLASGLQWPTGRVNVDVEAVHIRKHGTHYDLPIAVAMLAASGQVVAESFASTMFAAELAMDGTLRPVRSAILAAEAAARAGLRALVVHEDNGAEALAAGAAGLVVRTARHLRDVVAYLSGDEAAAPVASSRDVDEGAMPDMLEVSGDARGRRALEIAAAGGHSLLLVGPPGAAKMKLARRLPSILPDLDDATTRELTRIYSVAGMNLGGALVRRVPFRAPHHTTSSAGLVGGGPSVIRPGEMSLAHGGVLFLDELSEFQGTTLLMLREPMAAGEVQIARGTGVVKLPARAHVVAAMNGCPCGQRGSFESRCRCTAVDVARHQQRGSALASVIEMRVELTARAPGEPASEPAPESSATIKARVVAARSLMARTKGYDEDDNTRRVIVRALERTGLTTTGLEKARGIACTIAALGASVVDGQIVVRAQHMIEALEFTASASIATNSPAATA